MLQTEGSLGADQFEEEFGKKKNPADMSWVSIMLLEAF